MSSQQLNVAMVLKLVDRLTGPMRPVLRQADRLKKSFEGVNKAAALAGRGFGKIGAGLQSAGTRLALGAAAVAGATALLTRPAIQFEKFQTVLETTEGSAEKARAAMDWVQEFAVSTPYELDKVVEAFVQLRAYGLDPTSGLLRDLGDTSAAMNKDILQAVEAVADAVTGENERLKEFGIKASKVGRNYVYSYTSNGETKTVRALAKDRAAIQAALQGIFQEKFGGSMDRLSRTWTGMFSNLMDQWTKFQLMIMNSGLFDWMKGKLREILDVINQMEADGRLQALAEKIGTDIQAALEAIWELIKGVKSVAEAAVPWLEWAAEKLGGWNELAAAFVAIPFAGSLLSIASGVAMVGMAFVKLSALLLANPIGVAIAAIGAAVYVIYDNWDGIVDWFDAKFKAVEQAFEDGFLNGVLTALAEFNPVTIVAEALAGLVEYLTGYSLDFEWSDILPEWRWSDIIPDIGSIAGPVPNAGAGTAARARAQHNRPFEVDDGGGEASAPAGRGRAALRGRGAAGVNQTTVSVGDIHVHARPGQDAAAVGRAVRDELRRMAAAPDRALHDGGPR